MDVVVVVWILAWLFVGVRVHDEVRGLTELSQTISQAGGAVEETGRALGALSPILFLYLPLRLGRIRERRAMRRLIENFGDEPGLERLLAHRALQTMSYRRLEHEVGGSGSTSPRVATAILRRRSVAA